MPEQTSHNNKALAHVLSAPGSNGVPINVTANKPASGDTGVQSIEGV